MLVEVQGHSLSTKSSPNPVTSQEADELLVQLKEKLSETPSWLQGGEVTAIGGPNSMFCVASEALERRSYQAHDIRAVLGELLGLTDEELMTRAFCQGELREPPGFIIPKLALLLAVMEHCQLKEVQFCAAIGSCPGLLIGDGWE
ncbi:unnamed protein product [Effrenium voratum]|uniref:Uncharacterized protein n=1 Tax=Effrenium voratum TaxID=2562239 RepID=A0AA36N9K6_9DINO|nr:unnamed protein product [Effrenium voratum]